MFAAALLASVFWQSASAQLAYPLRFGVGNPLSVKGEKAGVRIRNVKPMALGRELSSRLSVGIQLALLLWLATVIHLLFMV